MNKFTFKILLLIMFVSFSGQLSTDIYLPSFPAMAVYFDVPITKIQSTIFYYVIGGSIGALFYGYLSDQRGRRPVIMFALCFGALGSLIACMSTSIVGINFGRFIQGFALVGVGSVARAMIRDVAHDAKEMAKIASIIGMVYPLVMALAPMVGGYIEKYSYWRVNFIFILTGVLFILLCCAKFLPETKQQTIVKRKTSLIMNYVHVTTHSKHFLVYSLLSAFASCAYTSFITVSPYLLQVQFGLSPEEFGYTGILLYTGYVLGSIVNCKLVGIYGINQVLRLGVSLVGIVGMTYLAMVLSGYSDIKIIFLMEVLLMMGCGFIYPNASAGAIGLFSVSAGAASAVYACLQMLGSAVGSGVMSLTLTHTLGLLGCLFSVIGIAGMLLINSIYRKSPAMEESFSL